MGTAWGCLTSIKFSKLMIAYLFPLASSIWSRVCIHMTMQFQKTICPHAIKETLCWICPNVRQWDTIFFLVAHPFLLISIAMLMLYASFSHTMYIKRYYIRIHINRWLCVREPWICWRWFEMICYVPSGKSTSCGVHELFGGSSAIKPFCYYQIGTLIYHIL